MLTLIKSKTLLIRYIAFSGLLLSLTACSYIPWLGGDEEVVVDPREPVDLVDIEAQTNLLRNWSVSIGASNEDMPVKMMPHAHNDKITFAQENGRIATYDIKSGNVIWTIKNEALISGGVGGNDQYIVIGTVNGKIYGYYSQDGLEAWSVDIGNEIGAVSTTQGDTVVIRTNDNRLLAVTAATGDIVWTVSQTSPALTLRGVSVPVESEGIIYSGMDNGKVIAVSLGSGNVIWESRVSIPSGRSELERLVDIDGKLAIDASYVYAASYHGRVVAIDRISGRVIWARDIASIAGVTTDDYLVYVTDKDDNVWALEKESGVSVWRQDQLLYRQLSAPHSLNDVILVGDLEGYIHALSKTDGTIIGRTNLAKNAIHMTNLADESVSYIVDESGRLAAYSIQSP